MNLSHSIPKSLHSDSPFKFQIHILQSSLPILKSFNSKFSLPDPKHFIPNLSSNSQITPCLQTAFVTPTIPAVFFQSQINVHSNLPSCSPNNTLHSHKSLTSSIKSTPIFQFFIPSANHNQIQFFNLSIQTSNPKKNF